MTTSRDQLQAVRYGDWKAHFVVQPNGWAGAKEKLNAPLLFNLRQDPFERADEESGMYTNWMGKKMWAFGPAQKIVKQHLATFKEWPPVTPVSNVSDIERGMEMNESGR